MNTGVAFLLMAVCCSYGVARNLTFPDGFMFGAATAAYQVEGAWNSSGKGESVWDRLVHTHPECIADRSTGDVAADSYHKYKEDVKALKAVGFDFYRFSISWARILPKGDVSAINQDGIDYYNNLINELLANNIQPVVTIFHWDLPQRLQDIGGLANPAIIDYFEDYARILYINFGDRVKWWITFNEPYQISWGYNRACMAPGVVSPGAGEYLAMHNLLKAHATAYRMYNNEFRITQDGKVGISLSADWGEPKSSSAADIEAAERYMQFTVGWFAHPIFSEEGDYPAVMKERIAKNSEAEGLCRSRLPEFDHHWIDYIKGTYDFFGLNLYTSVIVSAPTSLTTSKEVSLEYDMGGLVTERDSSWPYGSSSDFGYTPFGMRKMLKWILETYGNVPILITENGWSDYGELDDTMRVRYYVNYLAATLDAINLDKVTVLGHTAWSLIDNFQWIDGYSLKFGLYYVDFSDANRPRIPKLSTKAYAQIIKDRNIPRDYYDYLDEADNNAH